MVLGFNVTYAVKRARMPITATASVVYDPSVNPSVADAGTRLVELCVVEPVSV